MREIISAVAFVVMSVILIVLAVLCFVCSGIFFSQGKKFEMKGSLLGGALFLIAQGLLFLI